MLEIHNSLLVQVKYITNVIEKLEDKPQMQHIAMNVKCIQ